jgi:pimeloyl-ACP methyl ester carboxylesterase
MKVVFVHGALVFDGAWWWHRMVEPLAALGLGSRAVELPSCVAPPIPSVETLGDMHADEIRAALGEEDEPVVLVGHSYGGMVITDAASGQENVRHLVYITSVMSERGEAMASFGGSELGPWMDLREEDGTMGAKAELAPEAFMQDCDEATIDEALERLTRAAPLAVLGQAPRAVAWREKPSTYVVCAEERATAGSGRDAATMTRAKQAGRQVFRQTILENEVSSR